jgi:DNA-binding transcriptional MerR regulator
MWEKRYNIIKPKRTPSNIRYFLDDDLQEILNIALLNKNGYRISKIAKMTQDEIQTLVAELSSVDTIHEGSIDGLVLSMFELNESKFNRILDKYIDSIGMQETMDQVIYPFLDKLSSMWFTGSIKGVHENFVGYIIRRKLVLAIDKLEVENPKAKAILYLPEAESQELSLLYIHYLLKKQKISVVNLGNNVPLIDILEAQQIFGAHYVFTLFNDSFSETPLQPYIKELSSYLPETTIFISGYQTIAQPLKPMPNLVILNNLNELEGLIKKSLAQNKKSHSA